MNKRLLFFLAAIFLFGCTTLKTPEIKGVVVDAETGKPITDAYVLVTWRTTVSGLGGAVYGGGGIKRKLKLKTDTNGKFKIDKYLTINWVPFPFGQGGDLGISIYRHGYELKSYSFDNENDFVRGKYLEIKVSNKIIELEISLNKPKNENAFLENAFKISYMDSNYALDEFKLFIKQYPDSPFIPQTLRAVAALYWGLGDKEATVHALSELIQKYPSSEDAIYAKQALNKIRTGEKLE
ncbi:MAG: hypothetical protein M0022_00865 [Desulfobacteraceae bacterium]|nr:hypothetical protein [Desulfobacteraceae bacterium]